MKLRIYADTSVIGGCLDDEFSKLSSKLISQFENGEAIIVLSDLTLFELQEAPPEVQAVLDRIAPENRENVELTPEARELAEDYVAANVVVPSKLVDAQHIAIAAVSRVDVVVSWNFTHIVNLTRIHGFNAVNLREGYPVLEIRTPQEVVADEEE